MCGSVDRAHSFPLGAAASLGELESDPHRLLERLRVHEPVSWFPAFGGWLITRRDLVQQVMRDSVTYTVDDPRFSSAQVVGPSMLSLDGAAHARNREPFVAPFRPDEGARTWTLRVEEHAGRLVNRFARRGSAELRSELAAPLAVTVIVDILGLVGVDNAMVLGWYDAIVAAVHAVTAGNKPAPAAGEATGELCRHVARTIAEAPGSVVGCAAEAGLSVEGVASNVAVT